MKQKRRIKRWLSAVLTAVAVILCLILSLTGQWDAVYRLAGLRSDPAADALAVYVLDAGNADCTVVTLGEETLLIDAGLPAFGDEVCRFLRQKGVTELTYAISTHPHSDHIGGMTAVLETVPVEKFVAAPFPEEEIAAEESALKLYETVKRQKIETIMVTDGLTLAFGQATVQLFWPGTAADDVNNRSVVCRILYKQDSFLFMGDNEESAEQNLLQGHSDLQSSFLKVGHHGSRNATSDAFLATVRPQIAVIPCGSGNLYGHPHSEVIRRLETAQATVYRSDLHGTVTVISNGNGLTVTTERRSAA